ncbi:MAG: relaxase/mobilization nuclease domain-containing protein [Eggerthellaceae bacterium]|nr:relaxase/mobilization nuclease domain-containing protein [Eggerthellaceae bacterium]
MATTRLIPLHAGRGRSVGTAIANIIDYAKNPQKTDNWRLISSYACDSRTADAEFALAKREYAAKTGRIRGSDDVIAYHTRQSFKPGEVTPEEANQIGQELAMSLTKGNNAFIVCTHIDRDHVHNHIIFNSTNIDCTRKFRNFLGSSWALRRISDTLCVKHGLSIIEDPKPSRGHYGMWMGEGKKPSFQERLRQMIDEALEQKPKDFAAFLNLLKGAGIAVDTSGKHIKLRLPDQKRNTRMDTLRGSHTEAAVRERITGKRESPNRKHAADEPKQKIGLLVDIEAAIRDGKGKGYEHWARVHNLKQLSQAVIYLKEHGDMSYEELAEKTTAAMSRFGDLQDRIKTTEMQMADNSALQKHIVSYVKTREVYAAYKKSGYSKKFKAEHEGDILIHQAAKKAFDTLGADKLPSVKSLREQYTMLLTDKKKAYTGYKKAKEEMRELMTLKANVDSLFGPNAARSNREETRG